jgi:phosphoribosyl-ATP pyrophosphohydrolase
LLIDDTQTEVLLMGGTLDKLANILETRKTADPDSSYVADLYAKGLDAILKKVGEEATEVILAANSGNSGQIVHEIADLWFHTMVLLVHQGLKPEDVLHELERRLGVSGLDEKARRAPHVDG